MKVTVEETNVSFGNPGITQCDYRRAEMKARGKYSKKKNFSLIRLIKHNFT